MSAGVWVPSSTVTLRQSAVPVTLSDDLTNFLVYAAEPDQSWNIHTTSIARDAEPYFHAATVLKTEAVVATDAEGMVKEGRHLASLHKNIVVKVPCIAEGLKATKVLAAEGKRVNMTLIFSASQALLAAKAGDRYVSPFVGRLDDISAPGMELVAEIIEIFDHYDFDCEVLAASLRGPMHVVEAARMGADIGTMPTSVFTQLLKHPLTDIGLARFLADWEKVKAQMPKKA